MGIQEHDTFIAYSSLRKALNSKVGQMVKLISQIQSKTEVRKVNLQVFITR